MKPVDRLPLWATILTLKHPNRITTYLLAAMGLTLSDAVRLLLTRVAHDKALPFEPLIPSATTIQAMKGARSGLVTKAASLDALFVDLNADT